MSGSTKQKSSRTGLLAVIGAAVLCLPCVLPALAGVAALSVAGAWIASNTPWIAMAVAAASVTAVAAAWWARRRSRACETGIRAGDVQAAGTGRR